MLQFGHDRMELLIRKTGNALRSADRAGRDKLLMVGAQLGRSLDEVCLKTILRRELNGY